MINWRSSSGSASTVGVMGQMSAPLSASPDAWTPCPRPRLKDEVVTQKQKKRERHRSEEGGKRDEDTGETKTLILWIWSACLSTDISIKLLSQVPRVLLTSYLAQIVFSL